MLFKRTSVVTLAAAAVAASIGLVPAQARAACSPTLSPTTIVVGAVSKSVTFKVTGCDTNYWNVGDVGSTGPFFYVYTDAPKVTFYTGPFEDLSNKLAGKHTVALSAYDSDYNQITDEPRTISFLRNTYWSAFNASPEPVKKGKALKITGDLRRANWDTSRNEAYKNHKVYIQRKIGSGDYVDYKSATTDGKGHLSTTVKATSTASWRVRSGANSISGAGVSVGDKVTVK